MSRTKLELSDLPTWRKVIFVLGVCATFLIGLGVFAKEAYIYASDPTTPNFATRETHPVYAYHRYLRYSTQEEQEKVAFRRVFIGVPMLPGLLALATSRDFWIAVRSRRANAV
jgi:hypothetical protein